MKAIIALQKLVLTPSSKVSDILRHAYLIACKLNLEDFKKWCELELNGYFDIPDEDVPKDRHIFGSFKLMQYFRGSLLKKVFLFLKKLLLLRVKV